jgi:cell division FtsZ-interacting protein ZapD
MNYSTRDMDNDDRIQLNNDMLKILDKQRRELGIVIDGAKVSNSKGLTIPLDTIDVFLSEMFESYSALKNK